MNNMNIKLEEVKTGTPIKINNRKFNLSSFNPEEFLRTFGLQLYESYWGY